MVSNERFIFIRKEISLVFQIDEQNPESNIHSLSTLPMCKNNCCKKSLRKHERTSNFASNRYTTKCGYYSCVCVKCMTQATWIWQCFGGE